MTDVYYPALTGDSFIDEKILTAYETVSNMQDNIKEAEAAFQEVSKVAGGDPCVIIETTVKLTGVVKNITEMVTSVSGTIRIFDGFENCIAMQIVLKFLQMCLLYAKRLIVQIKLKIAELTKKMILEIINGKGSAIPDAVTTAVNAAFAALGIAINAVIQVIDLFMQIIAIGMLGIDGQGMVFFLTPKSMNMTSVNIFNANSALSDRFPQVVHMALHEIQCTIEKANSAIKKAALATGAAKGAVDIMLKKFSFGVSSPLSRVNPGQIMKLIDMAMDLIPLPLGLPKYEKLKFTNLGFLAFLITGFELSAHQSFGIPGYF